MKNIGRLVALAMLLILIISSVFAVSPVKTNNELDTYADTLTLMPSDDGTYIVSNAYSRGGISVKPFDGREVYSSSDDTLYMRINPTAFIKAKRLEIDIDNYNVILSQKDAYEFSPILLEKISKIMDNVAAGRIELSEPLVVYYPEGNEIQSRGITSERKTYTGYNGQQYYQELLTCSGNSKEFDVKMPKEPLKQYWEDVFVAGVKAMVDGVFSSIDNKAWTLFTVFGQGVSTSISTSQASTHTAKLFENKYSKITYLMRDGQYVSSSVIDYAYEYFYENLINVDGKDFYSNGRTAHFSDKATGYDNADEYAYRAEGYQNYNNQITQYRYRNSSQNVDTFVDSLF